jgi:hypothetical protein
MAALALPMILLIAGSMLVVNRAQLLLDRRAQLLIELRHKLKRYVSHSVVEVARSEALDKSAAGCRPGFDRTEARRR